MQSSATSLLLRPLYWGLWRSAAYRSRKLLQFAAVEANGGRDLVRAAELTPDPRLRRLYLAHARDEERHARLFRGRGLALQAERPHAGVAGPMDWLGRGERGLDDLRVDDEDDAALLAFIHLSERAAAGEFARYRAVLGHDPPTQAMLERILRDEESHMRYSLTELQRVSPGGSRRRLWWARLRRLFKAYLRFAAGLANVISTLLLTLQYFVLLPPFALAAKWAARREPRGWRPVGAAPPREARGAART
ncbi:MAG: ferritin-like domain-containing protein [Novosphingobium sp.]|nr:ferritin-like domain-containing protein [Novosphingobium sp.]